MDKQRFALIATACLCGCRVYVVATTFLSVTSCASDGWDDFFYASRPPVTHFMTGQLIAEMARDAR